MTVEELESFSPGDWFYDVRDQLKRHIYDRSIAAFRDGDSTRDSLVTPEQVRSRQGSIRNHIIACIGGLPSVKSPLNPRTIGVIEESDLRIEKVIFESRPNHHVTANLYLPT